MKTIEQSRKKHGNAALTCTMLPIDNSFLPGLTNFVFSQMGRLHYLALATKTPYGRFS